MRGCEPSRARISRSMKSSLAFLSPPDGVFMTEYSSMAKTRPEIPRLMKGRDQRSWGSWGRLFVSMLTLGSIGSVNVNVNVNVNANGGGNLSAVSCVFFGAMDLGYC